MNDTESHYLLPYWFVSAVERNLLSSAIEKPLEILFPFSVTSDLQGYLNFIECMQILCQDFQDDKKFTTQVKQPIKFFLSHLLTKSENNETQTLLPLFKNVQTNLESTSLKIDLKSFELLNGCFAAYNALFRSIENLENFDEFAKQSPLILSKNLVNKTSNHNELILAIRLERLRQSNLLSSSFHLPVEELLSNLDFYKDENNNVTWFQQAQVFLETCLEKYRDFLKPIDLFFGQYNTNFDKMNFSLNQNDFSFCLQLDPNSFFQDTIFSHQQLFCQNFIQNFFKNDLDAFIRRIAKSFVDSSYIDIPDFSFRMSEQVSKVDAKSFLKCSDGYLLNLPIVFVEWYIRSSPTHPIPLPSNLNGNTIANIFKSQTFESLESRFDAFIAACMADPEESLEIFETKLSCFATKSSRENSEVLDFLKSEMVFSTPVVVPEATQAKENVSIGDYKLKKHVLEELEKIVQFDPDQYHEIKGSYFASLNPDRRKMILEIQEKLGIEKFQEQLKPSLIKFMIENPTLWNQVRTKEKILTPKSSFQSKPERLI